MFFGFISLPPLMFSKNWTPLAQYKWPWVGNGLWELCSFIFNFVNWRSFMIQIGMWCPSFQITLNMFGPKKNKFLFLLWVLEKLDPPKHNFTKLDWEMSFKWSIHLNPVPSDDVDSIPPITKSVFNGIVSFILDTSQKIGFFSSKSASPPD